MSGLTPKQIHKAIYGPPPSKESLGLLTTSPKRVKPVKVKRKTVNNELSLLLDCFYSTTACAYQLPTPSWFTSSQKVDVSIIVPIYNNDAKSLIDSIDLSGEDFKCEMIFVDDNCPLNSLDSVFKIWNDKKDTIKNPIGKLFRSEITQGLPACRNIGAEKASGEFLVFLDANCQVKKGWLRTLIRLLRRPELGVVSGLIVNNDEVETAGGEWHWQSEKFRIVGKDCYNGRPISKPFKLNNCPKDLFESQEREMVSSSCMAVRRKDFLELGGFNPSLKNSYWSDADLCSLFREKQMKIMVQSNCIISSSGSEQITNDKKGQIYFSNRWCVSKRLDPIVKDQRSITPIIDTILIKRQAAHGDVLMAAAIAPALKKKHPNSKIVFNTLCPIVLENNPWIDKIQENQPEKQFQMYVNLDMAYEYRPNVNILKAYADLAGVNVSDCKMHIHCDKFDLPFKDYVVIHAGKSQWVGRSWTPLKFDALSKRLKENGFNLVCVGDQNDHKTTICDFDAREKTSIHQLAHVIKNCQFFIGIDSFPMHVAQVFDIPGAVFFGSIKPETRLITSKIKPVVAENLECLGCHHRKPTPCISTVVCDVGIQDCVNKVSVDLFWRTINEISKR